jgi:hypothetical protein
VSVEVLTGAAPAFHHTSPEPTADLVRRHAGSWS